MKNNQKNNISVRTRNRFAVKGLIRQSSRFHRRKVELKYYMPDMDKFSAEYIAKSHGQPEHKSLEKFPLRKLKVLRSFLLDILETEKLDVEEERWYALNVKRLSILLEGGEDTFCSKDYLYRIFCYRQKKRGVHAGRLFSNRTCSYAFLPKEIRGILIQHKEYLDFDMENAHPTILLEYALEHMKGYQPELLHAYVTNRDAFLKKKSDQDGVSIKDAKKEILIAINCKECTARKLRSYSFEFFQEISVIRAHIYNAMYYEGSVLFEYFKGHKEFYTKTKERQKVSVQSMYCQSKETDYVCELIAFVENAAKRWMEEQRYSLDKKWERYSLDMTFSASDTDRYVYVDPLNFLVSCIPFFDGVYIGSEDGVFKNEIGSIVESFNNVLKSSGSLVKFKEKRIDCDYKRIDENLYDIYYKVSLFVDGLTTAKFHKLLVLMDITPVVFEDLSRLEDMIISGREFKRELYKRVIDAVYTNDLTFDVTLYDDLSNIYKDRMKNYKTNIEFETESYVYNMQDAELFSEDVYPDSDIEDI